MFEFERQFSPQNTTQIVASEAQQLTAEQRQRDVYESHRHRVFAVSYYMTANEMEAENVLAETFVSAFATHRDPDGMAVDKAMVGRLEERLSLEPVEPAKADAGLTLARVQTRRTAMEEALQVLPSLERLVFLLKDVEGYATDRVAKVLEMSELEVQRTLMSARIRMRNALAAAQRQAEQRRLDAEVRMLASEPRMLALEPARLEDEDLTEAATA